MSEGPSKIIIPQREIVTCDGCNYYTTKLFSSGRYPVYYHICKHPDVISQLKGMYMELDLESDYYPIPDPKCPFK